MIFKESSRPQILRSERHQRWTYKAQVFSIHRNHENPNYRPPRLPMAISEMGFVFRCLSVPPKSWGPEGFMHRMVQRLLEGETTVLQLFASPLGWLNHMLATHRAPKTWNFPIKKLGEDFLKVRISAGSVFQRREFFGMHDFWNKTWFFKKCRIFFENRGKIEEPFPGTTSTSEGQSLRSGGF